MPIKKVKRIRRVKRAEKVERASSEKLPFPVTGDYAYIPEGDLRKLALPVKDIKLLEDNPRKNSVAARKLSGLIKENGFRKPIVLNTDMEIKAGNTAYKAAKILGMKYIPAVRSAWFKSEEEWRYVLSDNKANEFSGWDENALSKLLAAGTVKKNTLERSKFTEQEVFKVNNFSEIKSESGSDAVTDNYPLFSEEELIDLYFKDLRIRGFEPKFLSIAECKQILNKLYLLAPSACFHNNLGARIVDTFCPHRLEESAIDKRSLKDSFHNDKSLMKFIRRQLRVGSNILDKNNFTGLSIINGAQSCNKWRPAFVKMIYNEYCIPGGTVFDPCFGYGGGIVGFIASKCGKYIGTDPSTKSYEGCLSMLETLCPKKLNKEYTLYNLPIELLKSLDHKNTVDLVFTSPPYFTKEQYSKGKDQSYNKYPAYNNWVDGFLKKMFVKVHTVLKRGKLFLLNIEDANIKGKRYPLVDDSKAMARKTGFQYIETKYYPLQSRTYLNEDGEKVSKVAKEHILFFRKM